MDGVYIATVVLALLVVLVCERYAAWKQRTEERRCSRRVHVNIGRATGWQA